MIMKATRMLTIRLEEDKQWRIRQYLSIYIGNILSIFFGNILSILCFENILSISIGNIMSLFLTISYQYLLGIFWQNFVNFFWEYTGNIMLISIGNILSNLIFQVWDHFQSKVNEGIQHNNPGKGIILSVFWIMSTKYHWSKNTGKSFRIKDKVKYEISYELKQQVFICRWLKTSTNQKYQRGKPFKIGTWERSFPSNLFSSFFPIQSLVCLIFP